MCVLCAVNGSHYKHISWSHARHTTTSNTAAATTITAAAVTCDNSKNLLANFFKGYSSVKIYLQVYFAIFPVPMLCQLYFYILFFHYYHYYFGGYEVYGTTLATFYFLQQQHWSDNGKAFIFHIYKNRAKRKKQKKNAHRVSSLNIARSVLRSSTKIDERNCVV